MITQYIFVIFFNILYNLLSFLPDLSWPVQASFFTKFFEFIALAGYLLPMPSIVLMIEVIIIVNIIKIIIALIKTIWQLLPFF